MMKCRFCQKKSHVFLDMRDIPISVTSDARVVNIGIMLYRCDSCGLIQKESTSRLQESYFNEFLSYPLSMGEEQIKFVNGIPYPRSELILKELQEHIKKRSKVLDIGTGSGSFLKSFKKLFPNCDLYAQDIQSNSIKQLQEVVDKKNIFIKEIEDIDEKFNLLSMIHLLGHIVYLNKFLETLKHLSMKNNQMIIQTPDLKTGFFDIVIIDQITHFSKYTLKTIISSKFDNLSFFDTISKELTLTINMKKSDEIIEDDKKEIEKARDDFKSFIDFLYKSEDSYIVLGSSPSSTYIGAILANRLLYFIDEDLSKIDKTHLNKKIKKFSDIDRNETIVLPFLDKSIIQSIKNRYKSLRFLSFLDVK